MKSRVDLIFESLKGENILDLGFVGNYPYELELHNLLKQRYKNVFGVDIRPIKTGDCIKANVLCLPIKSNIIDSIFAGEIIEHFVETKQFINECKRVLKEDGVIVITTPNKKSYLNRLFKISFFEDHRKLFDNKQIEKELESYGPRCNTETFVYDEFSLVPHSRSNSKLLFLIRRLLHRILPKNLHEGIFLVCKKQIMKITFFSINN